MTDSVFALLNTLHEAINDTEFKSEIARQEFNARVCFRLRLIKLALERAAKKEETCKE